MTDFLRKYQIHILSGLLAFFLIYIALGFGGSFFTSGAPTDAVAEVDGAKIPLRLFYARYSRALDQIKPGTTLDEAGRTQKRDEVLRDLIQGVVFDKQAKRYGIQVPDQQVISSLAQVPAFQEKGVFSPQLYGRALQYQLKSTPEDFEEEQRGAIAFFKLRYLIQSSVKVTDKEVDMARAYAQSIKNPDAKKTFADLHDQLWQEKTIWTFNQWFGQIGQKIKVKPHLDLIQGVTQ